MSIKNLQELSTLVTDFTKKNRFIEVMEDPQGGIKYLQLIKGLSSQKWDSDQDAELEIYGNQQGAKTFEMLKSRAKERLVNMIFQLDTQKRFKSSYDKAYFMACKNLLSGLILFVQGRLNSGEEQLKLSLKSSKLFHFTDLSLVACRLLRNIASFTGPVSKFKKYNEDIRTQREILNNELISEELFQELALEVVMSVANKDEFSEKSKNYYQRLQSIVKTHDTYTTRINMYRVGLRYYQSINDYQNSIKIASECEDYMLSNPHLLRKVRMGEMSLNKLYGSLHLRDYENGSIYADECMAFFNSGTLNWLIFLEYFFLLCLHTQNYSRATNVYKQVISHPGFSGYPPQSKEKWKIFEAFLIYALPDSERINRRFNIPRFINEVPIFFKDKAGYNFSIIVAQVILSIKIGDLSKIVEKAEALKLYASRYIKKDKNPRSYYFVKMLLVMIKYDFDPEKTEQIARKFYLKLKGSHIGEQSELETLEVVPYDLLWPELLHLLRKNQT